MTYFLTPSEYMIYNICFVCTYASKGAHYPSFTAESMTLQESMRTMVLTTSQVTLGPTEKKVAMIT